MKYQAVVFDFDYTLGDSTEGILSSVRYGMERLGRGPMERESVRRTIGLSLQETYRALTGDSSGEQADKVMVGHTELFPDTMELLQALKGRGMRAGIVTTKYHYRIDAILEKCHAAEYIDLIVGGEDVSAPKPDPEGLFLVLETWGLPREQVLDAFHLSSDQVLYVGDSAVDAKTADAAGVDFAGVTTGTAAKEELEKYPCIGVYRELSALKKALMI